MTGQKYKPVMGLEIHAELKTNSKMFCGCSANYSAAIEPNTLICPVCTGMPGALPVINKKAVEQAILVGLALNCSINESNIFARKNYFYPDLPKGYQISQYDLPVACNGWLEVTNNSNNGVKRIRLRRAHLEEDTAKLFHQENYALVDFNRAGVPLLEIVSEPEIYSVEALLAYATKIRAILRYLDVNSGDMEKGVLRFEANVSVRPSDSQELRTRTEIKNLNSFRSLTRASTYEIQRQIELYESGNDVIQETLGWDDVRDMTISQRSKEHAHDYRYFPEPDLPPLVIDHSWVKEIKVHLPELPEAKSKRFNFEYGLKPQEANLLTSEKALAEFFEKVISHSTSPVKVINNWVVGEFMRYVNEFGIDIDQISIKPEHFAQLVDLVTLNSINANSAKIVLKEMFNSDEAPKDIVKAKNLDQISDENYLKQVVAQILEDNPQEVSQYLAGKETIIQWLMGQVARATKGKADPQVARHLLMQALNQKRDKADSKSNPK